MLSLCQVDDVCMRCLPSWYLIAISIRETAKKSTKLKQVKHPRLEKILENREHGRMELILNLMDVIRKYIYLLLFFFSSSWPLFGWKMVCYLWYKAVQGYRHVTSVRVVASIFNSWMRRKTDSITNFPCQKTWMYLKSSVLTVLICEETWRKILVWKNPEENVKYQEPGNFSQNIFSSFLVLPQVSVKFSEFFWKFRDNT